MHAECSTSVQQWRRREPVRVCFKGAHPAELAEAGASSAGSIPIPVFAFWTLDLLYISGAGSVEQDAWQRSWSGAPRAAVHHVQLRRRCGRVCGRPQSTSTVQSPRRQQEQRRPSNWAARAVTGNTTEIAGKMAGQFVRERAA